MDGSSIFASFFAGAYIVMTATCLLLVVTVFFHRARIEYLNREVDRSDEYLIFLEHLVSRYERQAKTAGKPVIPKPDLPNKDGFVYLLRDLDVSGHCKIGRTTRPRQRMKSFGVLLPFEIELVTMIKTDDCFKLEQKLHLRYAKKRKRGEWFALTDKDILEIKELGDNVLYGKD